MAFVPNTAAPAPIILHHTPSDTATPALLYPGETAVCHGPTHTKFWIGDGITNRLFLSTNPADSPLLNQTVLGGPFLPLTGGTLTGPGNLTLDGGTLMVSSTYPQMILDVTGTIPRQWRMEAEDSWWGLTTGDGVWPFYLARDPGPPVIYGLNVRGNLYIREGLTVEQSADIWGPLDAQQDVLVRNWAVPTNGGVVRLRRTTPVDVAGAHLGSVFGLGFPVLTWDPPGIIPHAVEARPGAEIRFNSTKAWLRNDVYDPNPPHSLLSSTEELGAEINFFVTRNDEGLPYRAMTLGQDGNLSLPFAVPTAATDVVTLGYLTGASTGFLRLTGGTLTNPGNLTIDRGGTLAFLSITPPDPPIPPIPPGPPGDHPLEWRMNAEDEWWGIQVDGKWPFTICRSEYLPLSYESYFEDNLIARNMLQVHGVTDLRQHAYISSLDVTIGVASFAGGIRVRDVMHFLGINPVTAAQGLGYIAATGKAGIENIPVIPGLTSLGTVVGGASIEFRSTQGWRRDMTVDTGVDPPVITSDVWQLGAEIDFFVSGSGGPQAYRAMTLEQNANLTVVGTVTASGSLLTSDPALKDNIAQAPSGALAKVCELPVIDFNWKHGRDNKLHRGFSATDVARVMGEDSGCSAEGAYSLADMNAMLWRAVQELSAEVQELKQRMH